MISPYLRRPLRSLDEILAQDGEESPRQQIDGRILPTRLNTAAPPPAADAAGETGKPTASNP
jgi:hypothetical protein